MDKIIERIKHIRSLGIEISPAAETVILNEALKARQSAIEEKIDENTSDGYHTFKELYDHRITLYIALLQSKVEHWATLFVEGHGRRVDNIVWRSKRHSDGELCFGKGTQFILGVFTEKGKQITYHIPIERWDETDFAETLDKAPEYDGHTSADVLERLKSL